MNTENKSTQASKAPPSNAETWKQLAVPAATPSHRPINSGSMPTKGPVTNLDFDVTENCNLGCQYCFKGEMYPKNMTLETMKSAFEWLLAASMAESSVNCNFMGGEPTMRFKQIRQFVPWAHRRARSVGKKATFSMTTNLTLFSDEILKFVDAWGFGVLMSIDGCPEVQDAQRPAKNGQQASLTIEKWAIAMLRTRPASQARSTLLPQYVHRLRESVAYLRGLGFREVAVSAAEYEQWTESHFQSLRTQLAGIVDDVVASYQTERPFNLTGFKFLIKRLIRHRKDGRDSEIVWEPKPCGAGRGYMMIDYTGDIWPCHRFDGADHDSGAEGQFRMGNIYDGWFRSELQSAFMDFDHRVNHKPGCTTCPVNEVCGGYCPAANLSSTKSIYTPADGYCTWSQILYDSAVALYDRCRAAGDGVLQRLLADCSEATSQGDR